jgi:putative sterol carrier protein
MTIFRQTRELMDQDTGTVRYLSLDWIDALRTEVARSAALAELCAEHSIGVTQVVTDSPEGIVIYHLQVSTGGATFGAGPADPEDVKFEQNWDTAVAVATGQLNPQAAFLSGSIRLTGDQQLLMAARPVFAALDHVFSTVRTRTRYE